MKRLLLLLGLVAWVVAIVLLPPKSRPDASAAPAKPAEVKVRARSLPPQKTAAASAAAQAALADPEHFENARTLIDAAVVTYSPEGVKAIRPFLLDPDPEVRTAARDGMVQLGEGDAIPLLRDAATKLKDPAEIASLQEAADLLALPAWSDTEEAATVAADIRDQIEEE
ncbi:HEAT repeat domain-containing protein [Luteolibacter sp. Populi]|uniref:HEAT repeat domain-containing protein n=1 Tax=Luteolibacter sp. Populi TaxID=3230487 RepID=UPI0034665BCE